MKNHSDMEEIKLMKGNEVVAEAAVRCGCDGYFGYPITPQSEVLETLMEMRPWETSGMTVIQAESEVAAINMVYGGAATGKRVMTSSSSPGISLMCEGLSYLAGAELPCVVVNVSRGGPGLGTIQPSQADYFQAVKGGGHGDYHLIVLAPYSVQEMYDFVPLGFDLAFKYRNPVMILSDGVIGQMMEKVVLSPARPRWTDDRIAERCGAWAATGKPSSRGRNIVTSVELDSLVQERFNLKLKAKYDEIRRDEVLRADALRRCRLRARGLRVFGPYRAEGGRDGPGGRPSGRTVEADHALPVPDRGDRRAVPPRERILVRRDEHGADGRGRDAGLALPSAGPPLRPHGGRRAFARRSIRCAEVELFIAVKGYGRI